MGSVSDSPIAHAVLDTDTGLTDSMVLRLVKLSPAERLLKCIDLCEAVRAFSWAGIRSRHPDDSDAENRKRFAAVLLGPELAQKYFNWDPEVEGY